MDSLGACLDEGAPVGSKGKKRRNRAYQIHQSDESEGFRVASREMPEGSGGLVGRQIRDMLRARNEALNEGGSLRLGIIPIEPLPKTIRETKAARIANGFECDIASHALARHYLQGTGGDCDRMSIPRKGSELGPKV